MMALAAGLHKKGHHVTVVAQEEMSREREMQGWVAPDYEGVTKVIAENLKDSLNFLSQQPLEAIHVTQGVRGNGVICKVQKILSKRRLRLWVVMETVHEGGRLLGLIKRLIYSFILLRSSLRVEGFLAIGSDTSRWLTNLGVPKSKVYPFSYFVDRPYTIDRSDVKPNEQVLFLFLGNLEDWKNPSLLLEAFLSSNYGTARLIFAGDGSEAHSLKVFVDKHQANSRVEFLGRIPMAGVGAILSKVDRLIMPSKIDGWGVAASEAMLAGVPVTCSTACGVKGAVLDSPGGEVFSSGDLLELRNSIERSVAKGGVSREERLELSDWAFCLTSEFGSDYLDSILRGEPLKSIPAWLKG